MFSRDLNIRNIAKDKTKAILPVYILMWGTGNKQYKSTLYSILHNIDLWECIEQDKENQE
jgi:hypothetical protein